MRRLAPALVIGWLLWVEMQHPETHIWTQVDRKEFATYEACEHERTEIVATAQPEGGGISYMMSRRMDVGNTFIVDGDRVRISTCQTL